ncbi:MAG: metallopeptidase family protein [Candidatus Omnitrophica bacterium]|nr:metallopeptidase family protein [Candidatus Omnitrophota bacterium]MCM8809211.1 metallopeptidase family protein [Candidatus Omnitrophota bacterium]MCM8811024.1 metallopeptidase family protein [Candidatus Omnitrophota bacterium]MCM8833552.1 metallopeptidase family protein [Candidatus Omnitrophota bacterium]
MKISKEKFEEIVYKKFLKIPEKIREKIENLEIIIEDKEIPNLLGLYHGVPFPKRKTSYSLILPDRIIIFKQTIERQCKTEEELENLIEKVLLHEIGHYLGLDEISLRKLNL